MVSDYNENIFDYIILNDTFETNISLSANSCNTIYVKPVSNLSIKEILPEEYELKSIEGINNNGDSINIEKGKNYKISFTNNFIKKNFFHSFDRIVNKITKGSGG